jgi:Cdc6-like AAA superfamily ATPase
MSPKQPYSFEHSNGLTTYTVQFKPPIVSGLIFRDKTVFQEPYIPARILHRETQLKEIWQVLNDIDRDCKPQNILGMGGLGSGKTVLVRHVCRALPAGCTALYVNCSQGNTRTRIIMSGLDQTGVPVVSGFDSAHYVDLFEQAVEKYRFVGLILDEADKFLSRKDSEHFELFYWLSRLLNNVFTIMLTNRADFQIQLRKTLDPRVLDTFRWRTIVFPDYGCGELLDILWDRFQTGFKQGTYSDDRLEAFAISKYAYDRGGGAREAIALALRVGETAEDRNHSRLEPPDVEEGKKIYEKAKELEFIRALPKVERTVLGFVLAKEPPSDEAYTWFKNQAEQREEASSYSIFQDSLGKLEVKGLIHKQKKPRVRGRGSEPMRLSVPVEMQAIILEAIQTETPPPQITKWSGETP